MVLVVCGSTATVHVRLIFEFLVSGADATVVILVHPPSFRNVVTLSIRLLNNCRFAAERELGLVGVKAHESSGDFWSATNFCHVDF